ncbi:hypothetical protein RRG08_029174 [Elysia crispata]|uniref:Uncharacterized protein n=1 Tax=Elysia crispata TaxID=231223 RepID=A0AAE1AIX8_9GAST|nr:hypothetical protein RRG08_029174 [Elysia crispata]
MSRSSTNNAIKKEARRASLLAKPVSRIIAVTGHQVLSPRGICHVEATRATRASLFLAPRVECREIYNKACIAMHGKSRSLAIKNRSRFVVSFYPIRIEFSKNRKTKPKSKKNSTLPISGYYLGIYGYSNARESKGGFIDYDSSASTV